MAEIPYDITLVQSLIESHLNQYMTKSEIVAAVSENVNINPEFVERIWEQLERQNREYFRAYNFSLMLISQINRFNELLEEQAMLMFDQGTVIYSESDSESLSSSSSLVSTGRSRYFGEDYPESSTGSTTTLRTETNAQTCGEKQGTDDGSGEMTLEDYLRRYKPHLYKMHNDTSPNNDHGNGTGRTS